MNSSDVFHENLDHRLRSLEKQNRGFRIALIGMLAIGITTVLGGSGWRGNDLLEARGLLLRGELGQLRGSFVVGDDGGVRLTLLDKNQQPKAGMWMDGDGTCDSWGFNTPSTSQASYETPETDDNTPLAQVGDYGKLIATGSECRVIERRRDTWVCAYLLTLRNDTNKDIEQPFYVNLVDASGYVMGRQARMVRLAPGKAITLHGEIGMKPERADQVTQAMLAVYGQ